MSQAFNALEINGDVRTQALDVSIKDVKPWHGTSRYFEEKLKAETPEMDGSTLRPKQGFWDCSQHRCIEDKP